MLGRTNPTFCLGDSSLHLYMGAQGGEIAGGIPGRPFACKFTIPSPLAMIRLHYRVFKRWLRPI